MQHAGLKRLPPAQVAVERCRAEALEHRRGRPSERDAMGRSVGKQAEPRWLWHALEQHRGTVVASVCGRRKEDVVLPWPARVAPCHLTRFSPDGWGAYERHLEPAQPTLGTAHPQKSASKPSHVRTRIKRLVRRTSCLSTTTTRHDLVLGRCIHRYAFGGAI